MAEPSAPSLLRLPLVILVGIAEALCPHCTVDPAFSPWHTPIHCGGGRALLRNTRALASLAATCKDLYAIVNPILYHQPQCLPRQRVSLIRTLATRPDLAHRVKVLRLDFDVEDTLENDDRRFILELARRREWDIEPQPDETEDDPDPDWCRIVDDDLPMTLLLSMCRNLEKLSAGISFHLTLEHLRYASLPRLKDVYVTHTDTEMGTHLGSLTPLFDAAPAIETFTSYMADSVGNEVLPLANLRHVHLDWACISAGCLRTLLQSCPHLESFSYQAGGATVGDEQFSSESLRKILLRYAPRVKSLNVEFYQDSGMSEWDEDSDENDPEPGPGFSSLAHLETLIVDPELLKGWEEGDPVAALFPQSLRSLTVLPGYGGGPGEKEWKAFASTAHSLLPNLTHVEIKEKEVPPASAVMPVPVPEAA